MRSIGGRRVPLRSRRPGNATVRALDYAGIRSHGRTHGKRCAPRRLRQDRRARADIGHARRLQGELLQRWQVTCGCAGQPHLCTRHSTGRCNALSGRSRVLNSFRQALPASTVHLARHGLGQVEHLLPFGLPQAAGNEARHSRMVATICLNGGLCHLRTLSTCPIDTVASNPRQLADELANGAAVALPERMQDV